MKRVKVVSGKRDLWREVYPVDEARRVAAFLVNVWHDIVPVQADLFLPGKREDKLTELFCTHLSNQSGPVGRLTGIWINEKPEALLDKENRQITKRIRKDITYFSNAGKERLNLIFEFKKLRPAESSYKTYQGEDGMQRFVTGVYAIGEPLAAMVGMTIGDTDDCINGLRRSVQRDAQRTELRMVPNGKGVYLTAPSTFFEGVAHFDTEHSRPKELAPPQGTIWLAHFFLPLPQEEEK